MVRKTYTGVIILFGFCNYILYMSKPCPASFSSVVQSHACELSLLESDSFICESDYLWTERKVVYHAQDEANMRKVESEVFFFTNWEPNFHCSHARRFGNIGDGGKWVCDPFRLKTRPNCLIYSVGSSGDFSFEVGMKTSLPNCEIHTFDQNFFECPEDVCVFHQMTFGDGMHSDESKTWEMVVKELGHNKRAIDILKIDIEGSEYAFFRTMFQTSNTVFPQQILVELHANSDSVIHEFFESLRQHSYVIFNKEPNLPASPSYFEYTFLRLNSQFFR